jgi:hypothetical protein
VQDAAHERPFHRSPLEDDQIALASRLEQLRIDTFGDHLVLARKPHGRRLGRRLAGCDERVETREQAVALGTARRIREPFGREECRDRQRGRVAEGEIGQRRQPRLEPVDDVEAAQLERQREVGARPDGHADPAPAGDRHGRAERDDLRVDAVEQCAAPRGELLCPVRRSEDRDRVPEPPQLLGDAGHVLVDVMRLRPRERRHQAESHCA